MEEQRKPLLAGEGINHPSTEGLKDLELGKQQVVDPAAKEIPHHPPKLIFGIPMVIIAGFCYCCASGCLILLNKHALASFGFRSPSALLVFQCFVAAVLVKVCEMLGYINRLQPLKWTLVRTWIPVNLVFAGMLGTNFYALQGMGVGMVTIWKNMANVMTAGGDYIFFKKAYPWQVWGVLSLMVVSAMVGASTDTAFNPWGYGWMIINCAFTSAYALVLRGVMDAVVVHTTHKQRMDEFSMVWFNNLLSIPPLLILMAIRGELTSVWQEPAFSDPTFLAVCGVSALVGFGISFTSLWFLGQTTATLYSLVGSMNKIPLAILGIIAFNEPTNPKNTASICLGLGAGILLTQTKRN